MKFRYGKIGLGLMIVLTLMGCASAGEMTIFFSGEDIIEALSFAQFYDPITGDYIYSDCQNDGYEKVTMWWNTEGMTRELGVSSEGYIKFMWGWMVFDDDVRGESWYKSNANALRGYNELWLTASGLSEKYRYYGQVFDSCLSGMACDYIEDLESYTINGNTYSNHNLNTWWSNNVDWKASDSFNVDVPGTHRTVTVTVWRCDFDVGFGTFENEIYCDVNEVVITVVSNDFCGMKDNCKVYQDCYGSDICIESTNTCKTPCEGKGDDEVCLSTYAMTPQKEQDLVALVGDDLLVSKKDACKRVEECEDFIKHGSDVDYGSGFEGLTGVSCSYKPNKMSSLTKDINDVIGSDVFGTCAKGADSDDDCEDLYGTVKWWNCPDVVDGDSFCNFFSTNVWAIDGSGNCIYSECAYGSGCASYVSGKPSDVEFNKCVAKNLLTGDLVTSKTGTYKDYIAGVCEYKITPDEDECETDSDCTCMSHQIPKCFTGSDGTKLCDCIGKVVPEPNCRTQTDYGNDDEFCMRVEDLRGLPKCKQYKCIGTSSAANCLPADSRKCGKDSDCNIGSSIKGVCKDSCCTYNPDLYPGVPPIVVCEHGECSLDGDCTDLSYPSCEEGCCVSSVPDDGVKEDDLWLYVILGLILLVLIMILIIILKRK